MSEPLHLVEPPEDDHYAPPQDIAAEQAVIGSALLSPSALESVTDLDPADFYRPAHEHIWRTIRDLVEKGEAVDALTVAAALERAGLTRQAGGAGYLNQCVDVVTTPANIEWHADIVTGRATLRRVIEAGTRIVAIGQSGVGDDPLAVVDSARETLDALAVRDDDSAVPTADAVDEAIAALDEPPGTPTPWRELTATIAGWKRGNVYIVGARPSVGKSIVGVNAALDVAMRGQAAVILSMEMTRVELFHRMLSQLGKVSMSRIVNRELTSGDRKALDRAAAQIRPLPLIVDDRSHLSVAQARTIVRKATRTHDVGLVVVDYVGLMKSTERHGSREQEVASFSRGLKVLAKDLQVPMLVLAQLNRGPEQRTDKLPMTADLRESGQLEADADVVILLHRDFSSPETSSTIQFHVGKNRHGPRTQIDLAFAGHYSTIIDSPAWG